MTSKKLTTHNFASAVIFKLNCSKVFSEVLFSFYLPNVLIYSLYQATPSSLYRPMFSLPNVFPRWLV